MTQVLVNLLHSAASVAPAYALLVIVVTMAGESCGLPIPSEVVVPLGGLLAAQGNLNVPAVVLAASVGNLAGSLVAWWLAARFGRGVILGPGRWVGFNRRHLAMAERWFARFGLPAVFFGRLLPVIRTYISFPAGLAHVRLGRFSALTMIGAIPWNLALALVGYLLGDNYDRVALWIARSGYVMAALVALLVIAWFVYGRMHADEPEPA